MFFLGCCELNKVHYQEHVHCYILEMDKHQMDCTSASVQCRGLWFELDVNNVPGMEQCDCADFFVTCGQICERSEIMFIVN